MLNYTILCSSKCLKLKGNYKISGQRNNSQNYVERQFVRHQKFKVTEIS